MKLALHQRGRAAMEFLGEVSSLANGELLPLAGRKAAGWVDLPATRSLGLSEKRALIGGRLADEPMWRFDRLYTRWVAEQNSRRGLDALEEVRGDVDAFYAAIGGDGGPLRLAPGQDVPAYWTDHEIHLTRGGWDGDEHMGTVIEAIVYPNVIGRAGVGASDAGTSIYDQRDQLARCIRVAPPGRVLELGCGVGRTLAALQRAYPGAQCLGCDLSASGLRFAHATAAEHGWSWELFQAPAERTGLEEASVDLVVTYALLHELPIQAAKAVTAEAFRVLRPGGELVHGDVPPYRELDAFRTLVNDWETEHRGEPFWRGACLTSRTELLESAGFVEVEELPLNPPSPHPWLARGIKPRR